MELSEVPIKEEAILTLSNDLGKEGFLSTSNDLCDNFVLSIAKIDGPKIHKIISIKTFKNKKKVSGVDLFLHASRGKGLSAELNDNRPHNIPIFFIL